MFGTAQVGYRESLEKSKFETAFELVMLNGHGPVFCLAYYPHSCEYCRIAVGTIHPLIPLLGGTLLQWYNKYSTLLLVPEALLKGVKASLAINP